MIPSAPSRLVLLGVFGGGFRRMTEARTHDGQVLVCGINQRGSLTDGSLDHVIAPLSIVVLVLGFAGEALRSEGLDLFLEVLDSPPQAVDILEYRFQPIAVFLRGFADLLPEPPRLFQLDFLGAQIFHHPGHVFVEGAELSSGHVQVGLGFGNFLDEFVDTGKSGVVSALDDEVVYSIDHDLLASSCKRGGVGVGVGDLLEVQVGNGIRGRVFFTIKGVLVATGSIGRATGRLILSTGSHGLG